MFNKLLNIRFLYYDFLIKLLNCVNRYAQIIGMFKFIVYLFRPGINIISFYNNIVIDKQKNKSNDFCLSIEIQRRA